jgi:hypothetical protein
VSHDEVVRGGDDEGGRTYGWFLVVGIAVVAALLSLLTHHTKSTASPPAPDPLPTFAHSATPTPAPSLAPSASPAAEPVDPDPTTAVLRQVTGFVNAQDICPVVTDGRTTMAISFVLQNTTPLVEEIVQVKSVLPVTGSNLRSVALHLGTCAHPGSQAGSPVQHVLEPGGTALITLHFGLPKQCPQPYPVIADIDVSLMGNLREEELRIFNDLGTVKFATCPTS